jgi:HTH-type transcriptional regulator/antitoxin HigA
MSKQIPHPGEILNRMITERGFNQRELASRLDIANSLLNNILNGNRAINIKLAMLLESINFENANFWLTKQIEYELHEAQNDSDLIKKQNMIKNWNEIENIVPISYFKKNDLLKSEYEINTRIIYDIYGVNDIKSLKQKIENYSFNNFRKSSKFNENKYNVIAWSFLAEYEAKQIKVVPFLKSNEFALIEELKKCFYKNSNTVEKTEKILRKYGIKFTVLDRPSQTPVDGKSFMCENNPSIVLSLKYNRLDNFAYTIMHELGHVFKHLTNPKYKNTNFFTNNDSSIQFEEFEADTYAKNNLIETEQWNEFILNTSEFDDDSILKFSKKIKVHPGVIRGRVCFENPEYYRKRTCITPLNILK